MQRYEKFFKEPKIFPTKHKNAYILSFFSQNILLFEINAYF